MAAAVAESSSSKGPVAARTCFSFGEWVLSSKEINFPYPVALTLLHMVFSSVVCFAITKVFKGCKFTCSLGYKKCQHILRVWTQSIITVGIEGFHGPGRGETLGVNPGHWPPSLCSDFIQNSALKDVDFASVHAYPDTWPLPPLPNLEVSDGVEKAADHALVWIKKLLNVFIKE